MDASLMKASALRLRFSQSLASRRQRLSQAMVRSTTQRLAQPLPPTGQVLGEPQPQRARLHQARVHSTHAPKTL